MQIAEIDATNENAPQVVKTYLWDPSEPVATRILHMNLWNNGEETESLYCTHDLQKNVTALFGQAAGRRAQYEYDPYGNLINISGDATGLNPFCYSSEYHDEDLGLFYYNYRHYNPTDGRWINRDPIAEQGGVNLYGFVNNRVTWHMDRLGVADDLVDELWDLWIRDLRRNSILVPSLRVVALVLDGPEQQKSDCKKIVKPAQAVDDAGKTCDKKDIVIIELRTKATDLLENQTGHVFLKTPNMIRGLYPHDGIIGRGAVLDDRDKNYDKEYTISYRACPESVKKLESLIGQSIEKPPLYDLSNVGALNCCGWACKMLEDSGFTPPYDSDTRILMPYDFVKYAKYHDEWWWPRYLISN